MDSVYCRVCCLCFSNQKAFDDHEVNCHGNNHGYDASGEVEKNANSLQEENKMLLRRKQELLMQLGTINEANQNVRNSFPQRHNKRFLEQPTIAQQKKDTLRDLQERRIRRMRVDAGEDNGLVERSPHMEKDVEKYKQHFQYSCDFIQDLKTEMNLFRHSNDYLQNEVNLLKNQIAIQGAACIQPPVASLLAQQPGLPPTLTFHQQCVLDMQQEAEIYRHRFELEQLKHKIKSLHGHPMRSPLPYITSPPTVQNAIKTDHLQPTSNILSAKSSTSCRRESSKYRKSTKNSLSLPRLSFAPYDPRNGFVVFWDYVLGTTTEYTCCSLVTTLRQKEDTWTDETEQQCFDKQKAHVIAKLAFTQRFQRCLPHSDSKLLVCLKMGHSKRDMEIIGWCLVDLFNLYHRLLSGRWKVPVRILPVNKDLTSSALNSIAQLDGFEVYFRVLNSRDAAVEEFIDINEEHLHSVYHYVLQGAHSVKSTNREENFEKLSLKNKSTKSLFSQPTTVSRRSFQASDNFMLSKQSGNEVVLQVEENLLVNTRIFIAWNLSQTILENAEQEKVQSSMAFTTNEWIHIWKFEKSVHNNDLEVDLCVQFVRIMDFSTTFIKITVTVVNSLIQDPREQLKYSTSFVKPTFLHCVHNFNLQKAFFSSLRLTRDSYLLFEVVEEDGQKLGQLVAWSVLKLFQTAARHHRGGPSKLFISNMVTGPLHLVLYNPPVPSLKNITSQGSFHAPIALNTKLIVFLSNQHSKPLDRPMVIPSVELSAHAPEGVWIESERQPLCNIFKNGDGFDVYIDAGRSFPECTVCAKVVLSLFDGVATKKKPFRLTLETSFNLQDDCFNPRFEARFEFRDMMYAPHTKLLFTVFVLDDVFGKVFTLGSAILPAFVLANSCNGAPSAAESFCLNSGGMQLKLYEKLDDQVNYDETKVSGEVLCASLLVRILPAAVHKDGYPKMLSEFPEDEWKTQGLVVPAPAYESGYYDTMGRHPTKNEVQLLHSLVQLARVTVKERLSSFISDNKKAKSEAGMIDWLKTKFDKVQANEVLDGKFYSKFNSLHGLFCLMEKAVNVPWMGFTFATMYLSPPGSYAKGSNDDAAIYVTRLHADCQLRHPVWTDQSIMFPRRQYYPNLCLVILLHEIAAQTEPFSMKEQAWTILPLFIDGYLLHGLYQIPVFHGSPSLQTIKELQELPLRETVASMRKKKVLKVIDGTSVFVCVGDARKIDDLKTNKMVHDSTFLPKSSRFSNLAASKHIKSIIPNEHSFEEFMNIMTGEYTKMSINEPKDDLTGTR